jgi:hypothetical protein
MVSTRDHAEAQRAEFLAGREAVAAELKAEITRDVLANLLDDDPVVRTGALALLMDDTIRAAHVRDRVYRLPSHAKDGETVPIVVT